MSVYEDMAPVPQLSMLWDGIVDSDPANFNEKIYIIIPDMQSDPSDPPIRIGPVRWMPRDAVSLPQKGNTCAVIFTNDREPWVIAWWPF